ncbi:MAG: cytochrome c [Acidobacteria bacterium]|nr:cytochrome c [Acidobacteriota bacterium]
MIRGRSGLLVAGVFLLAGVTLAAQVPQPAQVDPEEGPAGPRVPIPTQVTTVKASRTPVKTVKTEVPVDRAARSDTPEFRGEGWFQQQCGVCHVGRWRKQGQQQPSAPNLAGVLQNASPAREAAVRTFIQTGSMNMPGFRNTFTPTEFEELIAYLKTL